MRYSSKMLQRSKVIQGAIRMRLAVSFTLACVLFSAVGLAQQLNNGAVNGTVSDSSGAAIPNVKVTATSPALQGDMEFTTTEQGTYRFPALPLGLYKFTYESAGFGTQV